MGKEKNKIIKFTKAVATGNDFIIVDNRSSIVGANAAKLAKELCGRKRGIGADGLLLVEESKRHDLRMRIFNPDGSQPEMCGNGSRCVALYAAAKKIAKAQMTIDTLAGMLNASVRGDIVKVKLTDPKDIRWNFCLMINKCPYKVNFVDSGVPHVVHFVEDLDKVDVKNLGSHIRYHGEFSPEGANADFVRIIDKHNIKIRTYERGVEDETLACGTGAVASAIISAEAEKLSSPVTVHTQGGEKLKIYFDLIGGNFRNVYLEGRAQLVFEGVIKI